MTAFFCSKSFLWQPSLVFKIRYFLHTATEEFTFYQNKLQHGISNLANCHKRSKPFFKHSLRKQAEKNVTKFQIWIHLVISALQFNLSFLNPSFKTLLSHFGFRLILLAKFGRICQKNNPFFWVCWGFAIFETVYYHNSIIKEKNSSLKRKRPHRCIIEVSIMTQEYF